MKKNLAVSLVIAVESVKQRVIGLIDDERVEVTHEYGINPSPVSPIDSRGYELIAKTIRGIDEHVAVEDYIEAIHFYYHLIRQSMGAGEMQ